LETESRVATAQRLGYVLEKAGNSKLAEIVHAWLPRQISMVPLAVAAPSANAIVVARWRILDNSTDNQP